MKDHLCYLSYAIEVRSFNPMVVIFYREQYPSFNCTFDIKIPFMILLSFFFVISCCFLYRKMKRWSSSDKNLPEAKQTESLKKKLMPRLLLNN